jgi:hypothetical protein
MAASKAGTSSARDAAAKGRAQLDISYSNPCRVVPILHDDDDFAALVHRVANGSDR